MTRRRPAYAAVLAVLLLVVGQLVALAHNAETKHITCSEHGEQLEAATLVDELHACEHDHFVGVEGEHGGEHDECALSRALHQHGTITLGGDLPPVLLDREPALARAAVAPIPAAALYRLAPKTSPPA